MSGSAAAVASINNPASRRARKGRRETVRAACNFCCARKIKCDALRPQCSGCLSRGRDCVYDTKDDDETRGAAIKRRCEDLERQLISLSLTRCDDCNAQAARNADDTLPQTALHMLDTNLTMASPSEDDTATLYATPVTARASEILAALMNSTDEDSAGILAALRIGLPFEDIHQPTASSSLLLREHDRSWNDLMVPASEAAREYIAAGGEQTSSLIGGAWGPSMTFNRQIWLREVVRYHSSTSTVVEHIQIVSNPESDSFGSPSGPGPPMASPSTNHGLRCTYQVPLCAVASMIDVGDVRCPFVKAYLELSTDINMGADVQTIFGTYAHVSALTSEEVWLKAPRLSQVIATMVKSIKLEGDEGDLQKTRCAMMWLHWLLWRWLLDTSAAAFQALPDMLKPTPWQLTVPHPLVFDFIFFPGLRDHVCQERILDCQWLTAACASISCDDTPDDFYAVNPFNGELGLSDAAKVHIARPDSWSLGPSVRPFFYNLDKYVKVRPPATAEGD